MPLALLVIAVAGNASLAINRTVSDLTGLLAVGYILKAYAVTFDNPIANLNLGSAWS
jgi:hypothetical protein